MLSLSLSLSLSLTLSVSVLASLGGIPMIIRKEKEVGTESIDGDGGAGVGSASLNEICTYYYAMWTS